MENNPFTRTERLFGKEAMERLASSCVAIFGLGGVGGNCCEALARSGVGHFVLVDDDTVSLSNINRQLIATFDTIGMNKVDVMEQRIHSINPQAIIEKRKTFYLPEHGDEFPFESYDYCIDCIDTITANIDIILRCQKAGTPVKSSGPQPITKRGSLFHSHGSSSQNHAERIKETGRQPFKSRL